MNIFVLDNNRKNCAQYHVDRHVVKMILESTQILSTVCRLNDVEEGYKITHKNHPCVKWCANSLSNWLWLQEHIHYLNEEYKFRFNHIENHKSYEVAIKLSKPRIKDTGLTIFALAMPEIYKSNDSIISYRNYYIGEKQHLAKWTKREIPEWFITNNYARKI
jgi:hypothetical protein